MTLASGFQTLFLEGLAAYIAAGNIEMTWNASGQYTSTQTGIFLGNVPPQTPLRVVTLTTYGVYDHPAHSDDIVGLQVRCRAEGKNMRKSDDMADAIFNLLHGKTALELSTGIVITQIVRKSAGSLGQDVNGLWSNVQNFYATTWRPSTHRT